MFKVRKVISVFKGKNKDKSNPTNYKGITLTSALSKLFEKVILSHIKNDLLDRQICFHIHYNLVLELIMVLSLPVML